ncbi:DUF4129 domain-containing protein [Flavobacterium humi]|uniref:DUF4129 domain-containing protein n=1 Tax=Flavobacterium humi TaxID=2562683 RepID=A0A4Z0L836_9FLAO|nr:DUF4129 domain-containing protein [Flavobacterium humi]TGD58152.1 DUF4129 domain-containing protein [Flavobacterium humi]
MLSFSINCLKKANALLCLFLLLPLMGYGVEDSLVVAKTHTTETQTPKKTVFQEKDILVDTDTIEARAFDAKFKSKYTDEAFTYEFKSKEKNAWDRFKEWLAGIFQRLFNFASNESSMNFVEILLKSIAVLIVVYVIYMIAKAILNKDGQWVFGKNSDKKIIHHEDIEKNIKNIDFEKLIQQTLKSGEKRLTIRYYYLWLLQKMSEKEIIEWDLEKTNSDYAYEIKNPKLKEDFAYFSHLYNYIWYGEFELDDMTFEKAKNSFDITLKTI